MENSMDIPQNIRNRTIIWSSNPSPEYITKEKEKNQYLKEISTSHIHCSIIHNIQDMKTT